MDSTQICNIALGWLGANMIMNIDSDESVEAQLCRANYDTSVQAALEAVDWTFARERKYLTPLVEEIIGSDFANAFQLPSDCVVVRWVSADGSFRDEPDWEKEGNKLMSNKANLYIKYTNKETDTQIYSSNFIHAIASQLAADICIPITGNVALETSLRQKFEHVINRAGGADGIQSLPQRAKASRLKSARFGRFY